MERVQNTILLHGVAYVQRGIALDTKITCIKKTLIGMKVLVPFDALNVSQFLVLC